MLSTSVHFTPPSSTVICHLAQENRKIDKDRCPLTDTQKNRVNKKIINTDLGKSGYGTTYHCNPKKALTTTANLSENTP